MICVKSGHLFLMRLRQCREFVSSAVLRFCLERRDVKMDGLENLITMLDYVLDTKRKRHIMGGILLSVSFLFGGMAITVMTIQNEEKDDEQ